MTLKSCNKAPELDLWDLVFDAAIQWFKGEFPKSMEMKKSWDLYGKNYSKWD